MKIVFAHGWACGPELWQPVLRRLGELPVGEQTESTCVDFGFFGTEQIPAGHFDLAVGHSFGLLWLLQQRQLTFDALLSVNGFARFSADSDFRYGTHPRIIARMAKKLQDDPTTVLSDFFASCEVTADLREKYPECVWFRLSEELPINRERLAWGLDGLNNWDLRAQLEVLSSKHLPLRIVAASEDRVVSKQLTEVCFGSHDVIWHPSDCHLLPLLAADLCTTTIQQLVAPR